MYSFSHLGLYRSDRMGVSVLLFIVLSGSLTIVTCRPEIVNRTERHLDCFVVWDEHMTCAFESQNCSQHTLTLKGEYEDEKCDPAQCQSQCCCSFKILTISGDRHNVSIWRGGQTEASKIIDVMANVKPHTPTLLLVKEGNRNFQVRWKSNMDGPIGQNLDAVVTYRKKEGGEEKVSSIFKPTKIGGDCVKDIDEDLESGSTYVVSVRSFYKTSGRYSDPSQELEFKTPASQRFLPLALILGLSAVAGLIAGAAIYCYVKVKMIWDNCPNPKIHIHPYDREFLKPELSITSSVSVEPLYPYDSKSWMKETLSDTHSGNLEQSSGFSTGSSCLSYANTEMPDFAACQLEALRKAFPNISPVGLLPDPPAALSSPASLAPMAAELGQLSFENKEYALVNPLSPLPMMIDSFAAVPTQMVCVSEYQSTESDQSPDTDKGAPAFPALVFSSAAPSSLSTDLSYQPCGADSGLSSGSSGMDAIAPCCDPTDRAQGASPSQGAGETTGSTMAAKCTGGMSGPNSFLPVDDSYQPFQSLVSQPLPDMEECLDQRPAEHIPDSLSRVLSGQCRPEPQRTLFSLLSAGRPVAAFTDSGYE